MEELVGKRCRVSDENSFFYGDCGVIDFFDGELYHVMIDGDMDTFAFEREAIQILDEEAAETKEKNVAVSRETVLENVIHRMLTKQELIKAINQAFPDEGPDSTAPIAAIAITQLSDGTTLQSITLAKKLPV